MSIRITKEDLLAAAGRELAQLVLSDSKSNGAATSSRDGEPEASGKKRRKRNKELTHPRSVSAQQILELMRARGPLRGVEIMEATGLSSTAVRAKLNELKKGKALNEVREGTIVRFAAARGTGAPRKTSPKEEGAPRTRRSKKGANKKATASAETTT